MTDKEFKILNDAIDKTAARGLKSKEAAWQELIRLGLETEESKRKHEEKLLKQKSKKK
ncbi:MAG: hypothetical protein JST68_21335 [Bacteroidetes bacterium]|nr:hypothetical protein [Bacteroidota bacterium]